MSCCVCWLSLAALLDPILALLPADLRNQLTP
jgi:hypothetical protein